MLHVNIHLGPIFFSVTLGYDKGEDLEEDEEEERDRDHRDQDRDEVAPGVLPRRCYFTFDTWAHHLAHQEWDE